MALLKFATDLTMLAEMGKLDPMIGRESEMELLTEALLKRRNSNACLVGGAGVGKTAIVEALACKIAAKSAYYRLMKKKVFSVDMDRIVDGAMNRWEIEERVRAVLEEVRGSEGGIILFIDNLHNFIREDGVAAILKRFLCRDQFKCICATTKEEYIRYVGKDDVLNRSFDTIYVREATREESIEMVEGIVHKYANYHGVRYSPRVIASAVDLSRLHITDIFLPGKAIAMIDKAGSRAQMLGLVEVTMYEIEAVVFASSRGLSTREEERRTDTIPIEEQGGRVEIQHITFPIDGPRNLLGLKRTITSRIIGQDKAVSAVCWSILRAHVGLRDGTKPIGCFLFAGPTGVGKTELAKVLAEEYYGSKSALVRLDMRQFTEHQAMPRLVNHLTKEVRHRPDSLVLFDEIEKAPKEISNVLLEILDDGMLSDGKGDKVDFSRTIVIVTSNSGSNLTDVFKAELLDRFDQNVVFKSLMKKDMENILGSVVEDFRLKVLLTNKIHVVVSRKLREFLVSVVEYEKSHSVRTLKRAFVAYVENKLADEILTAKAKEDDFVIIDTDPDPAQVIRCEISKFDEHKLSTKKIEKLIGD